MVLVQFGLISVAFLMSLVLPDGGTPHRVTRDGMWQAGQLMLLLSTLAVALLWIVVSTVNIDPPPEHQWWNRFLPDVIALVLAGFLVRRRPIIASRMLMMYGGSMSLIMGVTGIAVDWQLAFALTGPYVVLLLTAQLVRGAVVPVNDD